MSAKQFEFVAPDKLAQLFTLIIGALLPLGILGAMAFTTKSRIE